MIEEGREPRTITRATTIALRPRDELFYFNRSDSEVFELNEKAKILHKEVTGHELEHLQPDGLVRVPMYAIYVDPTDEPKFVAKSAASRKLVETLNKRAKAEGAAMLKSTADLALEVSQRPFDKTSPE